MKIGIVIMLGKLFCILDNHMMLLHSIIIIILLGLPTVYYIIMVMAIRLIITEYRPQQLIG